MLVEAAHDASGDQCSDMLRPVQNVLTIFEEHSSSSDLARKGLAVLRSLMRTIDSDEEDEASRDFVGSAGKDLQRAIGVMRRKRAGRSSATHGDGIQTMTTGTALSVEAPAWAHHAIDSSTQAPYDGSLGFGDLGGGDLAEMTISHSEDLFETLFGLGHDTGLPSWDA